jgi:hypothetical protein
LFVATFLTLLFLPALYALWFRRSLDQRAAAPAPEAHHETHPAEPRPLDAHSGDMHPGKPAGALPGRPALSMK